MSRSRAALTVGVCLACVSLLAIEMQLRWQHNDDKALRGRIGRLEAELKKRERLTTSYYQSATYTAQLTTDRLLKNRELLADIRAEIELQKANREKGNGAIEQRAIKADLRSEANRVALARLKQQVDQLVKLAEAEDPGAMKRDPGLLRRVDRKAPAQGGLQRRRRR